MLIRSEGPATGHFDKGFSWFHCVYKQTLRWFPRFQVATTCFSCSPPHLNLLVTNFIFCIHVNNHCHRVTTQLQLINIIIIIISIIIIRSNGIDAASGTVFSVSDRPVCSLRRNWLVWVGALPVGNTPNQPNQFLLNLHTGRSLTENTIPDAISIQFDLMMSTELLETCRGL